MDRGLSGRKNPPSDTEHSIPASLPAGSMGNSFAQRCARLLRLAWHVVKGLFIAWRRYPGLNERARRATMKQWSRELLQILHIRVRTSALSRFRPARRMLVSNHVSWLDIFVLSARLPAIFVAKSEIRRWPFIGFLCHRVGTLFIERGRRSSTRRMNAVVANAIENGALVSVFPEGTTTDGRSLAHFHAALFQPAIEANAWVQPVALQYLDGAGNYSAAPNYVGDSTLLQSLWNITGEREIIAEARLLEPLSAVGGDRRALAAKVRQAILRSLSQRFDREPETGGGPQA